MIETVGKKDTNCKVLTVDRMFTTTHLPRPRPRPHDFTTTPTTKGWRLAMMPPWASTHIGGSRSMPTVHRCPPGKPWVAQKHHTRVRAHARLNYFHGSEAGSLKPQIYVAATATEHDDKIRCTVLVNGNHEVTNVRNNQSVDSTLRGGFDSKARLCRQCSASLITHVFLVSFPPGARYIGQPIHRPS